MQSLMQAAALFRTSLYLTHYQRWRRPLCCHPLRHLWEPAWLAPPPSPAQPGHHQTVHEGLCWWSPFLQTEDCECVETQSRGRKVSLRLKNMWNNLVNFVKTDNQGFTSFSFDKWSCCIHISARKFEKICWLLKDVSVLKKGAWDVSC